jgi:hypothetical protein
MELRGAFFLTKLVVSLSSIVPSLKTLDLSCCEALDYVLIQVPTLINSKKRKRNRFCHPKLNMYLSIRSVILILLMLIDMCVVRIIGRLVIASVSGIEEGDFAHKEAKGFGLDSV